MKQPLFEGFVGFTKMYQDVFGESSPEFFRYFSNIKELWHCDDNVFVLALLSVPILQLIFWIYLPSGWEAKFLQRKPG